MAFWGTELKPSKPFVHSCENARGRLRISQATLGIGCATGKSIVQCILGNRSPVFLCALLPNQTESCHLDLEFEEADDVIFSVIGPRSVYLTGYYICKSQQPNPHSDTESYGVDIENSQTEESNYCGDDDKYEDSFIDDGDELQVRSPSPVSGSKVVDETMPEENNVKNRKGRGRRLRKKFQVVESDDDDANTRETGDEDGYLLSVFKSKKIEETYSADAGENNAPATVETGEKLENDGVHSIKSKEKVDLVDINGKQEREKLRKKRKERSDEENNFDIQIDRVHKVKASTNMESGDGYLSPPPESGSKNRKRSKKRKKEEGTLTCNVGNDYKSEQDLPHTDSKSKDVPAENGDQGQQIDNNIGIKSELLANASQPEKKVKKKKNKKTQDGVLGSSLPNTTTDNQENMFVEFENQTTKEKPIRKRTLSNGLVIEEVAEGPPDGKVATPGKKVKVYYTAMLKENGHVVDTNVGKTACKFRLGDEGNMDGWNLGIDGMRVGDKRRLIIPPSMGFRKHGAAENVPPDSWLVYDVELVSVRK
ncbi:hypothetical protein OROGR_028331 [Orobanche gracilis]